MNNGQPEDGGGPAFPFACQGQTTAPEIYYGMTLRDWFAGMALQGIYGGRSGTLQTERDMLRLDAEVAYDVADAMLAARQKEQK